MSLLCNNNILGKDRVKRMASQQTPNYRLSRWAGTDRILVEEFNDNWDKIDAALFSKLGRAELITTITTDGTGRTTATIPLAGIDWDKWQAVFFVNKLYTDTTKTLRFFRLLK